MEPQGPGLEAGGILPCAMTPANPPTHTHQTHAPPPICLSPRFRSLCPHALLFISHFSLVQPLSNQRRSAASKVCVCVFAFLFSVIGLQTDHPDIQEGRFYFPFLSFSRVRPASLNAGRFCGSGGGGGGGGGREDVREKSEWRKPVGSP